MRNIVATADLSTGYADYLCRRLVQMGCLSLIPWHGTYELSPMYQLTPKGVKVIEEE